MAYQGYRHESDKTVGSNEGTKSTAPGHEHAVTTPPPGGENKTPAPLNTAGDVRAMLKDRAWGRAGDQPQDQNSGKNGFGLASSLHPGEKGAPATLNPQAGTDAVLEGLQRGGLKALDVQDDWQTRKTKSDAIPTTFGMHKPAAGATVPSTTGHSPMADEANRRAAALKAAGK